MEEEWIESITYPGYEISTKAIRNKKTKRILKGYIPENYYPSIKLKVNGKSKIYKIHRILAEHFIPNPNNYKYVNHIDGNKNNYSIENLEWVTSSQNIKHAFDTKLRKSVGTPKSMDLLDSTNTIIKVFPSVKDAAKYVGCTDRTISEHMKNKLRKNNTILIKNNILRYSLPPEDDPNEFWKTLIINNVKNEKYEISDIGNIRNTITKFLIKQHLSMGYMSVGIDGKQKYVHRLVLSTFCDNFNSNFDVNHKDKNKLNNKLNNLENLSRKEHLIKDHGKPVYYIENNIIVEYDSISLAAEAMNVQHSSITRSINNDGFCKNKKWKFKL